jgi:hypothetical protein
MGCSYQISNTDPIESMCAALSPFEGDPSCVLQQLLYRKGISIVEHITPSRELEWTPTFVL